MTATFRRLAPLGRPMIAALLGFGPAAPAAAYPPSVPPPATASDTCYAGAYVCPLDRPPTPDGSCSVPPVMMAGGSMAILAEARSVHSPRLAGATR